jgi:hypothetical protein
MVEYLPTTHKVLDSILSTANAQTKKTLVAPTTCLKATTKSMKK